MRITGGQYRGQRLHVPKEADLRPTTDKVREALFSVLGGLMEVEGARVLDLYAGTGSVAFEALSRGAAFAALVEENKLHLAVIQKNIAHLKLAEQVEVFPSEVEKTLSQLREQEPFDLVFADPPYGQVAGKDLLRELLCGELVAERSIFVFEDESSAADIDCAKLASDEGQLQPEVIKRKTYGASSLQFVSFRQ